MVARLLLGRGGSVFLKLALVSGVLGDVGRVGLQIAAAIGALMLVSVALVSRPMPWLLPLVLS